MLNLKKKINKEDYPQPHYGLPKIISSIFPRNYTTTVNSIDFNNVYKVGSLEILKNEFGWELLEGDVINIKVLSLPTPTNPMDELLNAISFKNMSLNITFLKELDPL